jgi:hypothetical protein
MVFQRSHPAEFWISGSFSFGFLTNPGIVKTLGVYGFSISWVPDELFLQTRSGSRTCDSGQKIIKIPGASDLS